MIRSQPRECLRFAQTWIRGFQDFVRQESCRVRRPAHTIRVCAAPPRLPCMSNSSGSVPRRRVGDPDEIGAGWDQTVCAMANDRRQSGLSLAISSLAINTLHSRITPELCDFLTSPRRCVGEGEHFHPTPLKARLLASRRHAARRWSSSIGVDSLTATKTTCGSSMFRATEPVSGGGPPLTSASAVCLSGPSERCRWM